MARPDSLTPERKARILQAIRDGNNRETACALVGINTSTLRRWCQRGRAAKSGKFCAFCAEIKQAEADAIETAVKGIRTAGAKSWQAFAWWLERKYPQDWGLDRDLITEMRSFLRERKRERQEFNKAAREGREGNGDGATDKAASPADDGGKGAGEAREDQSADEPATRPITGDPSSAGDDPAVREVPE